MRRRKECKEKKHEEERKITIGRKGVRNGRCSSLVWLS